jgi:hypothetical protein
MPSTSEDRAERGSRVGDFVIKNLIRPGTEWVVPGLGAHRRRQTVTVTAGKFEGCVVVEVTRRDPVRTVDHLRAGGRAGDHRMQIRWPVR